jgi:hypothetical protein
MKIIILSFFLFSFSFLFSQGNLQFNQVITYSQLYTTTLSGSTHSYSSQIYTVPVGKVWKIEKFIMRNNNSVTTFLKVNNAFQISPTEINPGPVWVKEGDQIQSVTSTLGGGNFTGGFFISIIEFNIIP